MDNDTLRGLMPYGPQFLLIDQVVSWQPGVSARGTYMTDPDRELAVADHFPDAIYWPGVYSVAGLAELAWKLVQHQAPGIFWRLSRLVEAKFLRPGQVGDLLAMDCQIERPTEPQRDGVVQVRCTSKLGAGKRCCTAILQFEACTEVDPRRLRAAPASGRTGYVLLDSPPIVSNDGLIMTSQYQITGQETFSLASLFGHPLWWLVLGVETPAQAGVVALRSDPRFASKRILFRGIENAVFHALPLIGHMVEALAELDAMTAEATRGGGRATMRIGGELFAESRIMFSFIPM